MVDRQPSRWIRNVSLVTGLGLGAGGLALGGQARMMNVLIGAALMAVLCMVTIPTRSGIRLTPVVAVIAALPLVQTGDPGATLGVRVEVAIVLAGSALVLLMSVTGSDGVRRAVTDAARVLGAGVTYVVLFDLVGTQGLMPVAASAEGWLIDWWQVVTIAVVTPAAFVAEGAAAAFTSSPVSRFLRSRSRLELRDFDIYLTLVVSGALFGLTFSVIGWFALIVAGVPFLLAIGSFRRLADTRRTYAQTVRALAQIPEAAGHVSPGHAVRVTEMATTLARYLGLAPTAVENVAWAAYLHDIGRISLNDPGVVKIGFTEADIAEWGAVIAEEATLHDVAEVIRRQHEPYRRPGQQPDPDLPLASRIIKVSSAYDDLVHEDSHSRLEALEQLHRGSVYDYDPDIVNALRKILEARDILLASR